MEHTINSARIIRAIHDTQTSDLSEKLQSWDFHDIAIAIKSSDSAVKLFSKLPSDLQSEIIFLLPDEIKKSIIEVLTQSEIDVMAHYLDPSEIAKLKESVPTSEVYETEIKKTIEQQENAKEFLQFASETAGEIMKSTYILVKENFTVVDVADRVDSYLINHGERDEITVIIATDMKGVIKGRIFFARLIVADKDQKVIDLISPVFSVASDVDQEDVISLIHQGKRDDIVVAVDEDKRPIGVIHATDLLKIMQQEATEDLYQFAGVHPEEKAVEPIRTAVNNRYKWLLVNLATAFVAAAVVSLFEDTLARIVVLAAYMPIVAGMGGNAGTQTLAVVVRGIATGEIDKGEGKKVVIKEIGAGIINGLIVGVFVSIIAFLWHGSIYLGLVLAVAMVVNMLAAGLFGTIIPLTLQRMNLDPAVSSSVFLTTVTDVLGFFVFLGLASIFL